MRYRIIIEDLLERKIIHAEAEKIVKEDGRTTIYGDKTLSIMSGSITEMSTEQTATERMLNELRSGKLQ